MPKRASADVSFNLKISIQSLPLSVLDIQPREPQAYVPKRILGSFKRSCREHFGSALPQKWLQVKSKCLACFPRLQVEEFLTMQTHETACQLG